MTDEEVPSPMMRIAETIQMARRITLCRTGDPVTVTLTPHDYEALLSTLRAAECALHPRLHQSVDLLGVTFRKS